MIARYTRKEMGQIWTDWNRYRVWLRVELAVSEQLARRGKIPRNDWRELQAACEKLLEKGIDPARVEHHERTTRHDVIAFTTAVAERIGPISRYIHFGLTSSDVVDTAPSLMIQQAGQLILDDVRELLKTLSKQAQKYRKLATIGRTHGMFAEPTSFGLKFLGWEAEWRRNLRRLESALEEMRYGKLSGAVGANAHFDPKTEAEILRRLGLQREPVSTQVLPRDRHAELLSVFAICGASMERIAIELRHLQRSEVAEVMEGFQKGQKGSSAMPHKRNPISSENLTGCARLLRSYAQAALENVALWHERDISHSAVERVAIPDAFILLDYALQRLNGVVRDLVVNRDQVGRNLEKAGVTSFSGHFLLALVESGATREDAYAWVQRCAMDSYETGESFVKLLSAHPEVSRRLDSKKVRELGSLKYQLRNVDRIFEQSRVSASKSIPNAVDSTRRAGGRPKRLSGSSGKKR